MALEQTVMEFEYPAGATPLDADELAEIRLPHITSRNDLDEWEQRNILEAETWCFGRKHKTLLSEGFALELHRRMFDQIWKWAGRPRTSDKNLGVASWEIAVRIRNLFQDAVTWVENHSYPEDELAARFHHRLVSIHPFVNGNGRHARIMADLLLVQRLDKNRFTWGSGRLGNEGQCRSRYLEALKAADARDYRKLLEFVRS